MTNYDNQCKATNVEPHWACTGHAITYSQTCDFIGSK